ncbi:MAG TPA: UDP-N-acetylmuramoyl-L-alanyl-D-glutamate--2,6-diaminopimelate ligase [Saprospiraceae bacterium]|nr:UDP-N-acetylmuramoyl-L-alanyl-D-glutamate--2,6-diaminopimelate ligase [Saprospiraceae bacterium]
MSDFLPLTPGVEIRFAGDQRVSGFTFDSRQVMPWMVFVARKGSLMDGHDFIGSAIASGSRVILCERFPSETPDSVCFIRCASIPETLGEMLHAFYDQKLRELQLIGVTGTNGKTTVATLLYQLFSRLGYRCGLISTVGIQIVNETLPATHTTPDQIRLFALLHQMLEKSCSHVFMEVSSHAVHQERIAGLPYKGAIFTNLSHDHLDYHGTFKAYIEAKKLFFDGLGKEAFALINLDDVHGAVMVQNTKARVIRYAIRHMAEHRGRILENSFAGLHLKFDELEWHSKLIGEFNAHNLLAVYATALQLGMSKTEILQHLSELDPPPGRFDWIRNAADGRVGIVDYAHTPDALEKILRNIQSIKTPDQRILTVVGCGGNRDKEKRPIMAKLAIQWSDQVILTSDNPRDEEPSDILMQMEQGIAPEDSGKYLVIEDRAQAIKTACAMSKHHDIILVAGKGHEHYQEIKGIKHPFDDLKILKTFMFNL